MNEVEINMKLKRTFTIILSIFAIIGIGVSSYYIYRHYEPENGGVISIEIIELDGTLANKKSIEFEDGDSLVTLLNENFENVVIETGMIMSIDSLTTPADWSTFICIYVDNEMSQVGILDIEFENGTLISFIDTKTIW